MTDGRRCWRQPADPERHGDDPSLSRMRGRATHHRGNCRGFDSNRRPADHEITESDAEDLQRRSTEGPKRGHAPVPVAAGSWLVHRYRGCACRAGRRVGAGGYLALRSHQDSQATARHDAAAVEAAKTCVAATQAPDTAAMAASAQKIIECGAGAFRSQAILYSRLLVEAYQAANAHVQVSDLRAAVERNNADGSIDILVPIRVKISNARPRTRKPATACG